MQGLHVVVIGGSSGIGLATAQHARFAGADVTIIARNPERLRRAAAQCEGAHIIAADITRRSEIEAAIASLTRIDHLVVTAGSFHGGRIRDTDPDVMIDALRDRLAGPVYAIKAALPLMPDNGSITLMSGQLADRASGHGTSMLSAAVRGIEGFAHSAALELQPIRVNVVAPGYIDTPIFTNDVPDGRAVLDAVAGTLPVRRVGTADETAQAILFLINNEFMNGEVLHIDGGGRLV